MRVIRDVHSFFQEDSPKIKIIWPILSYTPLLECVYAALEINDDKIGEKLREFEMCNSAGKKLFSTVLVQ
jgi:hypothetical protein